MRRILHLSYTEESLFLTLAVLFGLLLYALFCKRGLISKKLRCIITGLYGLIILWYTLLSRKRGFQEIVRYRVFREYRNALARFYKYNSGNPIFAWRMTGTLREMLMNVLLFIPFGCLLQAAMPERRVRAIVLYGFVMSLAVEILQLLTLRGTFDLCDLINNPFGTLIGALLCKAILRGNSHRIRNKNG